MPALVGGIGPLPLRTSAQAEAAAGAAPPRPTPAPLPIEGLWVCCVTAAPGEGLKSSSSVHLCMPGLGGRGGGGGRATVASTVGPPGDRTRGSGRVEHDLHPAAPPPRRHELADRKPRPSVGVAPRAGVPVLRGWLGRLRGWHHRIPHGEHPRDGGQHRAGGRERVPGRGEGPVAPEEALDGAAVGDTHPMAPGALCLVVPPLDQEHPALGSAGPRLGGGGTGAADGEGTHVPEGRQQGGDLGEPRALPPMEAGGPPERGRPAIPLAEGLVERGARHCQALGDTLQGQQPPPGVRARVHPVEEASYEDVLQAKEAGDRPLGGVESAGDGREGPCRALAAGRQRAAHMGELEAEGRCRVAPRHPAARLLLPGLQAAAGNRLRPAPAHPVWGWRREGAVRGYATSRRGILLVVCAVQREGRCRTHL